MSDISVSSLLATPDDRDEYGRPEGSLERCACDALVPVGDDQHARVCEHWEADH